MKKLQGNKMLLIVSGLILFLTGCASENQDEDDFMIIKYNSFDPALILIDNLSGYRLVAFKGTPSLNTLISGIPALVDNHGLEKKESLFNSTGDFVLTLITELDFRNYKSNLFAAPVFTRIYAFYNHEAENNNVYQISSFLGGDGKIIINNTTSWNLIIRKDSPAGEPLGLIEYQSFNSILKLKIPLSYNLYPVFTKFNPYTKEITTIIPTFTTVPLQGTPYMRSFNLQDSTPHYWDLTDVASTIDFSMTSGGFYLTIKNNSDIAVTLSDSYNILATSLGLTQINSSSEQLFLYIYPEIPIILFL